MDISITPMLLLLPAGLFDGTISGMASDLAQGVIGRRMNRSRLRIDIDLGSLRGAASEASEKLLIQYFDNLGIPRETLVADATPSKRTLWPEIRRQVNGGEISMPDVVNSFRTVSRLSSAATLKDRIIFSKGLPVAKLERSLTRKELPKDLRLSLDRDKQASWSCVRA